MNAQKAARILAKENDSVVVVGIRREATGGAPINILKKYIESQGIKNGKKS